MNGQTLARMKGEWWACGSLIRLLCAVAIWRTAVTRILPLCGSAAWWTMLMCLLPGFAVALLLRWVMRLSGSATIPEAIRSCLGKWGAAAFSIYLAIALLVEGVSAMTALTTLFTEGIGTRGTQLTLALLTGGVLLLCLHRNGLARAVYFLRWGMGAAAVVVAVFLLSDARLDHLFPIYGRGDGGVFTAVQAGFSMAWPVVLLLTVPPSSGQSRLRSGLCPAIGAVAAIFLLALVIPQEWLEPQEGLASLLLLTLRYSPNALRVLALCLLMLAFFLSIGAAVQLGTEHLCLPFQSVPVWLPYVLLVAVLFSQAGDVSRLWRWLGRIEPWLLVPLSAFACVGLLITFVRRIKL